MHTSCEQIQSMLSHFDAVTRGVRVAGDKNALGNSIWFKEWRIEDDALKYFETLSRCSHGVPANIVFGKAIFFVISLIKFST